MGKTEGKKNPSTRRDYYTLITGLALIGTMIFRIVLSRMIGDKGLACYGIAYEIYLVLAGALSYGFSEAVAVLVRYRIRREQYKNAGRVLKSALMLGGGISLLCSVGIALFGHQIAEKAVKLPLSGLAVDMMSMSVFFFVLTGVFRGYFQGNGSRVPAMHSQLLQVIILFCGGLIFASVFHEYGRKVSALLQNEDYGSAYGAMGAALGLLVSSVFCFLHMLVLYLIYRKNAERQMSREASKGLDGRLHIFHILLGTGIGYFLYWLFWQGQLLAGEVLLVRFAKQTQEELFSQWGAYYGRVLPVLGIVSGILAVSCVPAARRIAVLQDKEEYRLAGEKMSILLHQCVLFSVPAAVFTAVFSENLLDVLFKGSNQQAALWMQVGSISVVFYTFAAVFMEILMRNRKLLQVLGISAGAFLIQLVLGMVLMRSAGQGVLALSIMGVLFCLVAAAGGFMLAGQRMQYTGQWLRSFLMALLSSAVSGIIVMLLNRALKGVLGELISLLICLVLGILVYMLLLVVTRAFQEEELRKIPGGVLLVRLAELLHFA